MATALQYITECPVCFLSYENPKVLPCDHSLCANCVDRMKLESQIKCPICNATHDVTRVRADFRLQQFLDALKEREQGSRVSLNTVSDIMVPGKCDLCCKHSVRFRCENCQQLICKNCKSTHLRSTANKHHQVTPIPHKQPENTHQDEFKQFKEELKHQFSNIKRKINAQEKTVQKICAEMCKLETAQSKALEDSDNMRQESIREVNDHYDSVDARIIEFIDEHVRKLTLEKKKLARHVQELNNKWEKLKQLWSDSQRLVNEERASILNEATKLSQISCPDVYIEDVQINVFRGQDWDATMASQLELCGGRIEVNGSGLNRLSTSLEREFTEEKQVELEGLPYALRSIRQQLWSCEDEGTIQIFNQDLELQSTLSHSRCGDVCDVTEISSGDVVLAGQHGLYHVTSNGESTAIDSGKYNSVVFYGERIYAYAWDPPRICVYEEGDVWEKVRTLRLPFKHDAYATLSVTNDTVTACSAPDHNILTMSLAGELLSALGEGGLGTTGKLSFPRLCQEDEDGSLLIAAKNSHRLQVVDKRGCWSRVQMEGNKLCDAVYLGNKLYVASRGNGYKLSMYTTVYE